ncbi:AMP-binding protein [Actinokineospora enzanensis]|uniref:AMP-binding protein n=1 Tax=Actinokineospora enzanensis TaxID=155975 RepID=UPI00036F7A63|nr:AMP-binding protein [Actinokineospora enzanensis]
MPDSNAGVAAVSPVSGSAALLSWVDDPRPDIAVRFADGADDWRPVPYPELAAGVRRTAAGLRAAGVGTDDVVVIVAPTGARFIELLFGTMLAGAVPCPAAPPGFGQDLTGYGVHLRQIVAQARPRLVATVPGFVDTLRDIVDDTPVVPDDRLLADDPGRLDLPRAELALLQFTSGSSGKARGVRVPASALAANVDIIRDWLGMRPDDPTASWLPMHHDMGLIGCLVTPVTTQTDLWLLSPQQFIRSPLRYLRCFGELGARLTAMPTFGLEHVVRRVRPAQLAGMDFSAWRAVIVGAERVAADTLTRFHELLAPFGLDRRSLLPAYGLAEGTLAVTGLPLAEPWTSLPVDASAVRLGAPAPIDPEHGSALVASGRPLGPVGVTIVDGDGAPLPEGHVGEIAVTGPSVADGYHHAGASGNAMVTSFAGGSLRTGDAGFLHDGGLYVLGRLGDSLKLRGRVLLAEDVEAALETAGLPRHRHTVLLGLRGDRPTAVIVAEHTDPARLDETVAVVDRVTEGADVVLVAAGVGTIPRTTSGKPKRHTLWTMFLAGELDTQPRNR